MVILVFLWLCVFAGFYLFKNASCSAQHPHHHPHSYIHPLPFWSVFVGGRRGGGGGGRYMGMRRTIYIKKRKTQLRCQKVPSPLMQGMPSVSLPLEVMLFLSGMLCLLGLGTLTQSVATFNPLMSLPLCHLENDQHEREIWNPSAILFPFSALACERIFI